MTATYPSIQTYISDETLHRRKLSEMANRINNGKINVTGSITLNTNTTTTTLNDTRISPQVFIALMPLTIHAASAHSSVWYSAIGDGQLTINHASSSNTDQTFNVLVIG